MQGKGKMHSNCLSYEMKDFVEVLITPPEISPE